VNLGELNDLAGRCFKQDYLKEESLQELMEACLPFFLYFRQRNGFSFIPASDVKEELAAEAISRAFISHKMRNGHSAFYLMNAFRDCCRERAKTEDRTRIVKIVEKCGPELSLGIGQSRQPLSPDVQARRSEFMDQVLQILEDHPAFSKKLVLEKVRGSTFPEMADLNGVSVNECKRVHQHDIYHLRKNISQDHSNEAPE